jgi:aminomethyltransferase
VTDATSGALRRTPLYDAHVAAGAKLVEFAGWEMPIQYTGIRQEHEAVRTNVGVFDVSHMGQVGTFGPQALDCLQHLVSNDVRKIPDCGAQYGLLCNPDGGVIDDLFSYRLSESEFLTVTNAANHAADYAWMQARAGEAGFDVDVKDCSNAFAMLAVQGPNARDLVAALADAHLPPRFHCATLSVAGIPMLVAGTGYTGEDGVELLIDPEHAERVWAAVVAAGAAPIGLGARDTLRLEACFHLYGNDLSADRDPIGAGLGWACVEATGFIGADAIAQVRADGPSERLVPFAISGSGIARQGNAVIGGGQVTSGTFSPSLQKGIGMAYVPAAQAEPGTALQIDVRGTIRDAVVQRKPMYRKDA